MNKKAMILYYPLLIGIALAIGFYYTASLMSQPTYKTKFVGELSLNTIKTAQDAEKLLIFIDQSAKYSANQTIYDLAQKGGLNDNKECGDYLGYNLWFTIDDDNRVKECTPKKGGIEENFGTIFNNILDEYTSNSLSAIIPLNNYNIVLKDKLDIIGNPKQSIILFIKEELTSFEKDIAYRKPTIPPDFETGTFAWPLDLENSNHKIITSCYSFRNCKDCSNPHNAIDIRSNKGDKVFAAADGTITFAGGEYNTVKIRHRLGYETWYLHNSKIIVRKGQTVEKNDLIAEVGGYGPIQYTPHLDFRIKDGKSGEWIDPLLFYNRLELSLKYTDDSNCNYFSQQYVEYSHEIKENIVT